MSLIEREALLEVLDKYINPMPEDSGNGFLSGIATAISCIEVAPTIDPIRAAGGCRCGECINYEAQFHGHGYCYHWDYETGMSPNSVEEDDFCSYGEPREVQEDE